MMSKENFEPQPVNEALKKQLKSAAGRIQIWMRCNYENWQMHSLYMDAAIAECLLPLLNDVEDLRARDSESRVEQIEALRARIVEQQREKAILRDKLHRANASRKKLEKYRKRQGIPITPVKLAKGA
ncbi:MAG TPA: hypothetical protein VMW24_03915 [Sedimentisphaerales bacterium]|nr:hypothetical protein [Sedimentisphaerales bacterium]